MSSTSEEYTLTWNDYGKNISISFNEILDQKELIDVTLVADGYLFNAHRLILSAVSPYFRQMFTQMPTNQQAYGMALNFILFYFSIENFQFRLQCF